jgi:hypothetical protein
LTSNPPLMKWAFFIGAVFVGTCLPPVFAMELNALSAAEKAAGWQLLFDGTTLAGWRGSKSAAPPSGWGVVDGAITRVAKSEDLITTGEFGDFEFTCEWKIAKGSNSGVLYRLALGEDVHDRTGVECQIIDDDVFATLPGHYTAKNHVGALYDLVAPARDAARPIGEWNRLRLALVGWHAVHWLNGQRLLEVDLASPAGRALIAQSKFRAMPKYATLPRGHLALQDHTGTVSFRNLKIRKITLLPTDSEIP